MQISNLKQVRQHLETLADWHQAEWGYLYPDATLADRITRMQRHLRVGFIPSTFVALGDELLGSAAIVENDMPSRPDLTPWLASVYIAPQHRGRGIGSELVRHVMQQAQAHDIHAMYLFTPGQQAFYTRLGWREFGHSHFQQEAVTIMRADLDGLPAST